MKKVSAALSWILVLSGLCDAVAALDPKSEGEAAAHSLHQKGYRDESRSLNQIAEDFKKNPENAAFEGQNNALSNTFEQEYDGGRKGEDPLKAHLGQQALEQSKTPKSHQPNLKESQNFAKQKHRFKIADSDPVLDQDRLIKKVLSEDPLDPSGKILSLPAKPKTPPQAQIIKCRQSAPQSVSHCSKRLVVRAIPQADIVKTVTARFSAQCFNLVTFHINLKTGHIGVSQCESPARYNLSVVEPLGDDPNLARATIKRLSAQHAAEDHNPEFRAGAMTPTAANGFTASLTVFQHKTSKKYKHNQNKARGGVYSWEVTIPQDPILEEHWEGCEEQEAQESAGFCSLFESEEHNLNETRAILDYPHPVTRPHWSVLRGYVCGPDQSIDTCEDLLKQGCTQINSECAVRQNGHCLEYENTFNCAPLDHTKETQMGLVDGKLSFLTEEQADPSGFEAGDFAEAATGLSALLEMAKTGEEGLGGIGGSADNPSVFQGSSKFCRVNLGSSATRNCCKLKGLLSGLLGGCAADEKALAVAALKKKRCVKVGGRYCKTKRAGICIEKRDVYCCYGSQIARIIQEIAHEQLGLSYGTEEAPQCQSLTAEQLSRLNFDTPQARVKLSEMLSEVEGSTQEKFKAVQQGYSQLEIDKKMGELEKSAAEKAEQYRPPVASVPQGTLP